MNTSIRILNDFVIDKNFNIDILVTFIKRGVFFVKILLNIFGNLLLRGFQIMTLRTRPCKSVCRRIVAQRVRRASR